MQTLSQLETSVRSSYLKIDPSAKIWSNSSLDYFLQTAYSKVQEDVQYAIPECETSTTISTINGTREYAIPSDFARLGGLFYNTKKLGKTSKEQIYLYNSSNSIPSQYYKYGSYIGLCPIPDAVYSLDMLYYKKLPALSSSQASLMGSELDDCVVLYACYLMFISVEKQAKATMCLAQYNIALNSAIGGILYDDDTMQFWLDRPTPNYRYDWLSA